MKAIVAIDNRWGIGLNGELLLKLPEDMKRFKEMTIGKVVIMGSKTYKSLPNGKPLPERNNIVISTNPKLNHRGIIQAECLKDLFSYLKKLNTDDIYIIGGQSIYGQLLPYCSHTYITKIYADFYADTYFPNLDLHKDWELTNISPNQYYNGTDLFGNIHYNYTIYINNNVKELT